MSFPRAPYGDGTPFTNEISTFLAKCTLLDYQDCISLIIDLFEKEDYITPFKIYIKIFDYLQNNEYKTTVLTIFETYVEKFKYNQDLHGLSQSAAIFADNDPIVYNRICRYIKELLERPVVGNPLRNQLRSHPANQPRNNNPANPANPANPPRSHPANQPRNNNPANPLRNNTRISPRNVRNHDDDYIDNYDDDINNYDLDD